MEGPEGTLVVVQVVVVGCGGGRGLLIMVTFRNDSSRVAIYATVSTKVVMKQYL